MTTTNSFTDEPVEPGDIAFVVDRLWGRGHTEFSMDGAPTINQLIARFEKMADGHSRTLSHNGWPVAVCGVNDLGGNVFSTWFIATEDFTAAGLAVTRYLRRLLKAKTEEHPGAKVVLVSACAHPDASRWFAALGFQWTHNSGFFTNYEYKRPVKGG